MSNQYNDHVQLDENVQELQPTVKHRARHFYRRRPANDRKNQDLAEDENRASNDEDTQQSNNSDENNVRGRIRRGGFRHGRGRGRFSRDVPIIHNYRQIYSPYTDYMNGQGGFYGPPGNFYGVPYRAVSDLSEQEVINGYPVRGKRGFYNGRGYGGRRNRNTKNENIEVNTDNSQQQQQSTNATTKNNNEKSNKGRPYKQQRRRNNEAGSGVEQHTDGAVTDDQQHEENNNQDSGQQQRKRSNRRRRHNTNPSQSGAETEDRPKSNEKRKPKDDETIVKGVLRTIVNKVARRSALRNRQQRRMNTKDATENATDVEKSQTQTVRRGGRGRRGGRPGNGYFLEQGYYDPYGMTPYYYGIYYDYGNQGYTGRNRGRGGRGRGRFRQRKGGENKENQSQDNNVEKKLQETKSTDVNTQNKAQISEQINQ